MFHRRLAEGGEKRVQQLEFSLQVQAKFFTDVHGTEEEAIQQNITKTTEMFIFFDNCLKWWVMHEEVPDDDLLFMATRRTLNKDWVVEIIKAFDVRGECCINGCCTKSNTKNRDLGSPIAYWCNGGPTSWWWE